MKKILIVVLAVAILAAAAIALAGVANTRHDPRILRSNTALEPCAFCHTPHGGNNSVAPLWNRSQAAQTYTVYSSTSFNMGLANATLDKGSAPCMVCHNGVASVLINYPGRGSVANTAYDASSALLTNTFANLGVDLQNEHPVSFAYNASLDRENNGFPTAASGTVAATGINFPLYAPGGSTGATQFSCASCHAVHHTPVATYDTVNQVYFLRTTNAGSLMCLACHVNR